jgi:hypothetical protein
MKLTRDQLLSAEAAYNVTAQGHGFAQAMLIPLEAALDAALADVPEPAPAAGMTRGQAVEKATAMVDAMSQPVTNARGYADGWKAPTLAERVQAIRDLTETLMGGQE